MIPAPEIDDDDARVASLRRMNLLSTPRERDFDRITRLARALFQTDMALISLVDKDRQWFKSRVGLDAPETGRDVSFCGHAIKSDDPLIVNDTFGDERFCDNPLVLDGPKIRFYAGQPLTNVDGFRVGTLCVISDQPRDFDASDRRHLLDLARLVETLFKNRELSETHAELLESLETANREKMIDPLTGTWNRRGLDELLPREIALAERERHPVGVAMLDIDLFKKINDQFGHEVGDVALRVTAGLMIAGARQTDLVARYAGDEFTMITPDLSFKDAPEFLEKLSSSFHKSASLMTPEGPYDFSVSLGLAVYEPVDACIIEPFDLLRTADIALLRAKEKGRNCFEVELHK